MTDNAATVHKPELAANGCCRVCGREIRDYGRGSEHKRGRIPGVPQASSERVMRGIRSLLEAARRAPPPRCPDCDAPLQLILPFGWRCPWTTATRWRPLDALHGQACDWPYANPERRRPA